MSDGATSDGTDALLGRLAAWLGARLPGRPALEIRDAVEPAQGFSSRTILFTAVWWEGGRTLERSLVARLQRDVAVPMLADVFHQYRVMRAIAGASYVRVPNIEFAEEDPGVLGAPFFLMDRIQGRVPPDFPTYHAEGWFAEQLTSDDRERHWWNGIAEMARLHGIDWRVFPFLPGGHGDRPPSAGDYIEAFIGRWFDWAAQGRAFPVVENALRFLIANQPPTHRAGLVWNDARLGNTMFRPDGAVASLLDFEVAALGPPEIDLAHWMYLDDIFSLNFGIPRISGIPEETAAIAGFERLYGWDMPYFSFLPGGRRAEDTGSFDPQLQQRQSIAGPRRAAGLSRRAAGNVPDPVQGVSRGSGARLGKDRSVNCRTGLGSAVGDDSRCDGMRILDFVRVRASVRLGRGMALVPASVRVRPRGRSRGFDLSTPPRGGEDQSRLSSSDESADSIQLHHRAEIGETSFGISRLPQKMCA